MPEVSYFSSNLDFCPPLFTLALPEYSSSERVCVLQFFGVFPLLKHWLSGAVMIRCMYILGVGSILYGEGNGRQPTPVLLPGKSHGWRSLVGCSPWGRTESDTTGRLHFHFSLSCIGEGNGNPLQCSCLENLRDGGAWWAAIYGVAQSPTRLKRISSSSSSSSIL